MSSTRNSRPSGTGRQRPSNRRTTPPPARVPWSIRIRGWARNQRPRLGFLRKFAVSVGQLALSAALLLVLYAAGNLLWDHVRSAPAFATKKIDIQGNAQLSRAEVEHIAGIAIGQNIFQVDEEQALERLRAEPWIAEVTVERHLPGSYAIVVRERHAIALLAAQQLYLISEEGQAFKPLSAGDPADLPLITGLDAAAIERDKRAAAADLIDAVGLLREYTAAGLGRREPISEIHVEADGSLSCYVGADATRVQLGKPPYQPKLRRLREVFGQLTTQNARAKYVLLDNEHRPDRVTVRLR
ncbi:MAG TPA: FtsQ-type POTRA domain-containing protein [Polyangiales bacterium]|nr:FtsQ-type POTRA domain-containing protein [Polyangiales bacterium]